MRAFWETIAREYTAIDSLRMDKFLFLIRSFTQAGFAYCAKDSWKDGRTRKDYLDLIRELEKVGGEEGTKEAENTPWEEMMAPMVELGEKGVLKSVRKKVAEALDDERVKVWLGIEDDDEELSEIEGEEVDDEEEDEEFGGFDD